MILGASGRLGRALWESRPQTLEVTALTHAELDVTDIRAVEAVIALARPDVVINAAAWTDVAGAQTNAAAARAVNAVAPGAMGRLFARTGVRIVHFSTDYVFSGEGSSPWNEASEAHPRQAGVYGVTKHEGERLLEESGVSGAIVRAGWLHSGERDFVNAILSAAAAGRGNSVTAAKNSTPTSNDVESVALDFLDEVLDDIYAPLEGHHQAPDAETSTAIVNRLLDVCTINRALPELTPVDRLTTVHYVEEGGWISRADMAVHALEAAEDRAIRLGEFKLAIRFRKAREGMRRTDADDGFRPLNCRLSSLKKDEFPRTERWMEGVDKSVDIVVEAKKSLWITQK